MTAAADQRAVHLTIRGRVQGVWYRGWTVDTATALGLRGWVRNRRDGSVEALLIGPERAVGEMIERCHDGPPAAHVEAVDTDAAQDDGSDGFRQRPTE